MSAQTRTRHFEPRAALARRTETIQPFHVMELVKRAARLEAEGRSIVHLSIGEPDFGAPAPVTRALARALESHAMSYTAATGLGSLRAAIARYYGEQFDVDLDPARILITAGASGALTLACAALVDPGDRVLMTDPSYPCNRYFVSAFDGLPQLVPVGPQTRFQLDGALVDRHWTAGVKGVIVASPANPTGTSIPFDELGRVLDVVRDRGGFAIVDEIYLGLSYQERPRSALSLGDDMVVTNSFSKFFNMTGWRLGWLVVPPGWVPAFDKLAQKLYICASALAQRAALACFEPETMAIYAERREQFRRRRDYIVPALRELGFGVPAEPDGAFYVYIDVSRFTEDSAAFADELLEQAGVAIVPGMDFGQYEPKRYMRVSYANSLDNLQKAVRRIAAHLTRR
ncbi:MAG: pyridoxal phosphate-dependent aminotransferase [Burkholderiales bacterium]|nr:MAG: pyridoxal phosphate-dependent aminotransferase [Burkholderiales bacterium]